MRLCSVFMAFFVLICGRALAADEFEAVRCGADVPKALLGKRMPSNERIVAIESRHADLSLKGLGADIITDQINAVSWSICGKEYMVLVDERDIVYDVLPFPPHSKKSPAFTGMCEIHGRTTADIIVAVLDNSAGYEKDYDLSDKSLLQALQAWKIDTKSIKFTKVDAAGIRCSRTGVYTVDGGA